jgi:hypothetical protein
MGRVKSLAAAISCRMRRTLLNWCEETINTVDFRREIGFKDRGAAFRYP